MFMLITGRKIVIANKMTGSGTTGKTLEGMTNLGVISLYWEICEIPQG